MRTETAINKRNAAATRISDLFSSAKIGRYSHLSILEERRDILNSVSTCPLWVRAYLDGLFDAQMAELYHSHLEYCSQDETGAVFSHNSQSDRYYQKHGFTPSDFSAKTFPVSGHFWKDTNKHFYVNDACEIDG
jgi:hypothetical protein